MTLLATRTAHEKSAAGAVASGDGGDDEAQGPRILVADSPPVTVSALQKEFRVADFFSVIADHGLIGEVDPAFAEIFGSRNFGVRPARRLIRHTLLRARDIASIENSFPDAIDIDLHAVAELVLRSNLRERGFGGLDDAPLPSGVPARKNLFRVVGRWIALSRERRLWCVRVVSLEDIFQEYTKVFVPYGFVS